MKVSSALFCLILLTGFFFTSPAFSETRYISDVLVVTLRADKAPNSEVLKTLITGTAIEVLEEDKTFIRAKTAEGIEGYIKKQYTTKETPKKTVIARLSKDKARLEQQLEKIQKLQSRADSDIAVSNKKAADLAADLAGIKRKLDAISSQYETLKEKSANVVQIVEERDQLQINFEKISGELEILREENAGFHRSNAIRWFLAGGGVFLGGWLVGKISRKKRRNF